MSFERYPEYKASGVPWMREVPVHWDVIAAKKGIAVLTDFTANGSFASLAENVEYQSSGFARLIRMTDLRSDLQEEGIWIDEHAYSYLSKSALYGGELLMASVGSVGLIYLMPSVPYKASLAPNMYLIKTNEGLHSKFLYWFLLSQSGQDQIRQAATTTAQPKLNKDNVRGLWISQPELSEQTAIATFLDHETAKIDALVAEQEKLITLLQEKRQAVISHAVTKGLNPNVPMKDSGVEWLGEVPEHWEVRALRRVIAAIEQGWSPECYAREAEDQEWGVLKAGCLNGGVFRPSENKALPPELSPEVAYEVRVGDVLMSRASGSPELVGSTALVQATRERIMLSDKIFRLKLNESIDAAFFVAALNSRPLRVQIENALSGGNGMANNLPQSSLLTFVMAVPPRAEQAMITVLLEQETAKLDALITKARTAITLLQERRAALISAAVTGQIDVRNWSAQEGA